MADHERMSYSTSAEQPAGDAEAGGGPRDGRGRNQWAFHVVAFLVCAGTTVAAGVATFLVSFGTSVCNEDDTTDELLQLRLGLAVVGLVLTAVPAIFAAFAAKLRFAWAPWAALAGIAAVVTLYAVTTAEVSTWCMF